MGLFDVAVQHGVEFLFKTFGCLCRKERSETFREFEFVLNFEARSEVIECVSEVVTLVDGPDE